MAERCTNQGRMESVVIRVCALDRIQSLIPFPPKKVLAIKPGENTWKTWESP